MSTSAHKGLFRVALPIGALIVQSSFCVAQSRPLWGYLEPGPYTVGFRVLYRLDSSRTWLPRPDSVSGEFARPIRVSMWYPSASRASGQAMKYRDYVRFAAPRAYFARLDSMLEGRDTTSWKNAFKNVERRYPELMELSVFARRDALPASGSYPLVMYSEGWNSSSQNDNTVLAEFLASHGYVVASVPQVGASAVSLTLGINPIDLETQMRDIEFAMVVAQSHPFVDRKKVALMGWSMGGVVSLWLSARNPNVDAVVGLDASFGAAQWAPMVLASPYFDIRQLRAPVLALQSGNPKFTSAQASRVVDSLHFAERYTSRVGRVTHGDFSDFAMVARLFPVNIEDRSAAEASAGHMAIARAALAFLDATLKQQPGKLRAVTETISSSDSLIKLTHLSAANIPDESEWAVMLGTLGFDITLERLHSFERNYPALEIIRYSILNRQGYALRDAGKHELAVSVFRLNAEAHPSLADAYDSLADGYIAKGDVAGARRAYEQVLKLVDTDKSLNDASRADYRSRAEAYLRTHPAV
jgi:dienelactone hydrolase